MSNGSATRYILDASIVVKWYLPDEEYANQAYAVFDAFVRGSVEVAAPEHINYEVANVLRTAVRQVRLSEDWARASLVEFLNLPIEKVGGPRLILRGYDFARNYGCAAYDGLYLALAEVMDAPLIHADRRLHNTLDGRYSGELWIGDYNPDASPNP